MSRAIAILKALDALEESDEVIAQAADVPPRATKPVISLHQYAAEVRKLTLDRWQVDLCKRLEEAFFDAGKRQFYHGPPQHGKTTIVTQVQPGWLFGHDPAHRVRLATYNIMHSARFSLVVQRLIRSKEHLQIFPAVFSQIPARCKVVEWSTFGRLAINDGQASFSALGLASGFTGTGYDTLIIDDPYKSAEEALSEVIRERVWRFWEATARARASLKSNVFGMFHRYHQDDIGGRAILSGEFDYIRYSAEADGEYEDEESGRKFADPLGRAAGEYLSERYPASFYEEQKKVKSVWNAQFQGRPTDKAGGFFDTSLIQELTREELPTFLHVVRSWDNASTEGAGAWSVGARMGIDAAGRVIVTDIKRAQINTAQRRLMQKSTAEEDGRMIAVLIPQDPGSAGKDVAFDAHQDLQGFRVVTETVTGSKELRAYGLSECVNRGEFGVLKDADWVKPLREEMKNFPLSTYKDQVDSLSDAYRYLNSLYHRGLVLKSFTPRVHLVGWSAFKDKVYQKVPSSWDVQAAVRIENDASLPSGACLVARASETWGDVIFVLAATRQLGWSADAAADWIKSNLARTAAGALSLCWLPKANWHAYDVLTQKHFLPVAEWPHKPQAGIPELNWYMQTHEQRQHPFHCTMGSSRCYWLVEDDQLEAARDDLGLLALQQDAVTWAYNSEGEPQPYGGVALSCLKMIVQAFPMGAAARSPEEAIEAALPPEMRRENLKQFLAETGGNGYLALRQRVTQIVQEQNIQLPEDSWEAEHLKPNRKLSHSHFRSRVGRRRK